MIRRIGMIALALAAGLTAACGDGPFAASGGLGRFDGVWDGAAWRGSAYAVLQGDSLTLVGHRPDPKYFYDEYVQARIRFTGPGTYAVPESDGQLAKITGGDAGWFPPSGGTLVVRAYSAGERTISGTITLRSTTPSLEWNASGDFDAPVYTRFTDVPVDRSR